jgi:hypothetical protein
MTQRDIPNTLSIHSYMHCGKCLAERPADKSPQEWGMNEVGFTRLGIQVWCRRHHVNVCHIDFQGQQHPANLTCARPVEEPLCPVTPLEVLKLIPLFKPMTDDQRLGFAGAGPEALCYDRHADYLIILDVEDGQMSCHVYASGTDDSWGLNLATGEVEKLQ